MVVFMLVFMPAYLLGGSQVSAAVSLGVLSGYLVYSCVHHATHHWRAESAWAKRRKLWHAMHHRYAAEGCCYGVTSRFWDHVFTTVPVRSRTRVGTDVDVGGARRRGG